jgi:hypothetical protein
MNVRSEPKVRPTLDLGEPASSLTTQVKRGMKSRKEDDFGYQEMEMEKSETLNIRSLISRSRNVKPQNETGAKCWIPGFRLPGDGDVKDSHHQESSKCRNAKTRNRRIAWSTGYRDFGYREMEMTKTLIIRSPEVMKPEIAICEIMK